MGRWRMISGGLMIGCLLSAVTVDSLAQPPDSADSVKAYPVPGRNKVIISILEQTTVRTTFQLVDAEGRIHREKHTELRQGSNTVTLHFNGLATGTYFIRIIQPGRTRTLRLILGTAATELVFNHFL